MTPSPITRDRCNNYPCAKPSGHNGPCSSNPDGDSLAEVVEDLLVCHSGPRMLSIIARIERLDAEMRKDYEAMKEIVAIADELRAKLAACEMDAARYQWLKPRLLCSDFAYGEDEETVVIFSWPDSPISANLDRSIDDALASRAAAEGKEPK